MVLMEIVLMKQLTLFSKSLINAAYAAWECFSAKVDNMHSRLFQSFATSSFIPIFTLN